MRPFKDQELTDNELIRRVCRRDTDAFETLYRRYHEKLGRFIYRINRRRDSVEEIINDVMWVVWQKAGSFNETSKVSTWILGIAYNKALKATSEVSTLNEINLDDAEPMIPGVQDAALESVDLQDWFSVALERLSPDQRAVVELTCVHGLPYQEIAEVLGCPENTVKTRMFHARRKLKPILTDLTHSEHYYRGEAP